MTNIDTDQPKHKKEEDRFQRYDFSKRIAGIINSGSLVKSLVVGIYGKWGEGKTSIMNFIKAELNSDVVIINFNPWLFSSEEQLIKSFFSSLAYELDHSLESGKEKTGKILSDYGEAIGTVTKFIGLPLEGLKNIGDKLQEVSIEKLKLRVDDMIRGTGKKIVVCVDDIDRLDVKEVQYIFKLIKLVGDFPGTTYVLAFDDEMVANALAPQYGNKDVINGYTFLEKIIQLPLKIPKATQHALKKYVLEMLNTVVRGLQIELTQDEVNKFRSTFDEYYIHQIDNPRLASRFANAVYFALPLLFGEVNTTDLILLEGLKILFPTAYDFTRHNSILFLTDTDQSPSGGIKKGKDRDQIIKEVNAFLQSLPEVKGNAVKEIWKQLFPQYRYATGNIGYRSDNWRDWYKQKRICSGPYFQRYFTYVVQEGDISDVFFSQLLVDLENLNAEECEEKMAIFFDKNAVSDIIFKLRLWEDGLSEVQSMNLAILLARRGANLPVEEGHFASFTTHAEGAKTIARLVANLPSHQRKAVLLDLFDQSNNLEFAMEIFYWIKYKQQKSDKLITDDESRELESVLVVKFKEACSTQGFFEILPDAETWRILRWWRSVDPLAQQAAVESAVSKSAENVLKLIKVFTPTISSWGGGGSRTFKSGFNVEQYESMSSIVDVEFAYRILQIEGTSRDYFDLSARPDREPLSDSNLINIFMQLFEAAQNKDQSGDE